MMIQLLGMNSDALAGAARNSANGGTDSPGGALAFATELVSALQNLLTDGEASVPGEETSADGLSEGAAHTPSPVLEVQLEGESDQRVTDAASSHITLTSGVGSEQSTVTSSTLDEESTPSEGMLHGSPLLPILRSLLNGEEMGIWRSRLELLEVSAEEFQEWSEGLFTLLIERAEGRRELFQLLTAEEERVDLRTLLAELLGVVPPAIAGRIAPEGGGTASGGAVNEGEAGPLGAESEVETRIDEAVTSRKERYRREAEHAEEVDELHELATEETSEELEAAEAAVAEDVDSFLNREDAEGARRANFAVDAVQPTPPGRRGGEPVGVGNQAHASTTAHRSIESGAPSRSRREQPAMATPRPPSAPTLQRTQVGAPSQSVAPTQSESATPEGESLPLTTPSAVPATPRDSSGTMSGETALVTAPAMVSRLDRQLHGAPNDVVPGESSAPPPHRTVTEPPSPPTARRTHSTEALPPSDMDPATSASRQSALSEIALPEGRAVTSTPQSNEGTAHPPRSQRSAVPPLFSRRAATPHAAQPFGDGESVPFDAAPEDRLVPDALQTPSASVPQTHSRSATPGEQPRLSARSLFEAPFSTTQRFEGSSLQPFDRTSAATIVPLRPSSFRSGEGLRTLPPSPEGEAIHRIDVPTAIDRLAMNERLTADGVAHFNRALHPYAMEGVIPQSLYEYSLIPTRQTSEAPSSIPNTPIELDIRAEFAIETGARGADAASEGDHPLEGEKAASLAPRAGERDTPHSDVSMPSSSPSSRPSSAGFEGRTFESAPPTLHEAGSITPSKEANRSTQISENVERVARDPHPNLKSTSDSADGVIEGIAQRLTDGATSAAPGRREAVRAPHRSTSPIGNLHELSWDVDHRIGASLGEAGGEAHSGSPFDMASKSERSPVDANEHPPVETPVTPLQASNRPVAASSPATGGADLSTTTQPDALYEIVQSVRVGIEEDVVRELQIQLIPESLGQLRLRLTEKNGAIFAQFVAETEVARKALELSLPELRGLLESQDVNIQELTVSVGSDSTSAFSGRDEWGHGHPFGSAPERAETPQAGHSQSGRLQPQTWEPSGSGVNLLA